MGHSKDLYLTKMTNLTGILHDLALLVRTTSNLGFSGFTTVLSPIYNTITISHRMRLDEFYLVCSAYLEVHFLTSSVDVQRIPAHLKLFLILKSCTMFSYCL